jgi:hypothetical protein
VNGREVHEFWMIPTVFNIKWVLSECSISLHVAMKAGKQRCKKNCDQ